MKPYNASWYMEHDGSKYRMECDMGYDDKSFYAEYIGDDLVDGVNSMIADLTQQCLDSQPEESLEEKVARLESQLASLQEENTILKQNLPASAENEGLTEIKDDNNQYKTFDEDAFNKAWNDFKKFFTFYSL